ncbi:hypothetical protein [Streptomyces sp. NPDC003943]
MPWSGEEGALARAETAGSHAAAWIRSLPVSSGSWLSGPFADAVEDATCSLDPEERDDHTLWRRLGCLHDHAEDAHRRHYCMPEVSACLAPEQQVTLIVIGACASTVPELLPTTQAR